MGNKVTPPDNTQLQSAEASNSEAAAPDKAASPSSATAPSQSGPARADLRPENINDAVIRLAGNSQDGTQPGGASLPRLAGRSDQDVMTYMPTPATISGGPSIFQVRMG